jgi:signal transduction histidine kinase
MLYPYNNLFPVSVITGEAARKRMIERSPVPLEFYSDFLDLGRFSGEAYEARMERYLVDKYRDRKPDVILALGPRVLQFAIPRQQNLGFDAPIVFCCTSRIRLSALSPPGNVTGILSDFGIVRTLTLAQRLQPDASRIVVVAGATEFDRQSADIVSRQLVPYEQKYKTEYLVGLQYDDLMEKLKQLPRDTIVILLTMFADSAGRLFISPEIVQEIAAASAAPVYSPYETYLGRGALGGHMESLERIGNEMADLAVAILADASPSNLAPRPTGGNADRVDWRQLKRWNISESRLAPGTEVRFREFTLWEQYRWYVIGILAVVLAQAAMIAWLNFERYRRRRAEQELRRRLLEVMHLNRTAVAGTLSASVAHELNQPLGAILSYAEAAELYLNADPPNLDKVEQILADIRRDDQRAADIIGNFRGLLKKKEMDELQEFDVNEVVRKSLDILDAEAVKRGIALSANQTERSLPVRADQVHLQQVILNLAVNGMDAMQSCPSGTGKMSIQTALVGESEVEVLVADSGTGIPTDKLNKIFDTFYATKRLGTGLGLSIARTIVEIYGGRIWAENRAGGGAMFRFTLPLSKAASV